MSSRRLGLLVATVVVLLLWLPSTQARNPDEGDQYCGAQNCYETLGITRASTPVQIRKAYYKLSLKYHPDKNKDPKAVPIFRAISTAYEVLGNAQTKADYDDMLDHPEQYYVHRMRYYRHRMKRVSASTVLLWVLAIVSLAHYKYWQSAHASVMREISQTKAVQDKLKELRAEREKERAKAAAAAAAAGGEAGSSSGSSSKKGTTVPPKSLKDMTPAERKQYEKEEMEDIKSIVTVSGWRGREPTLADTVPVWLFWLPYRVFASVSWAVWWVVGVGMLKRPITDPVDKNYATAQAVNCPWGTWKQMPASHRNKLIKRELWVPKNLSDFVREMQQGRNKYR